MEDAYCGARLVGRIKLQENEESDARSFSSNTYFVRSIIVPQKHCEVQREQRVIHLVQLYDKTMFVKFERVSLVLSCNVQLILKNGR